MDIAAQIIIHVYNVCDYKTLATDSSAYLTHSHMYVCNSLFNSCIELRVTLPVNGKCMMHASSYTDFIQVSWMDCFHECVMKLVCKDMQSMKCYTYVYTYIQIYV